MRRMTVIDYDVNPAYQCLLIIEDDCAGVKCLRKNSYRIFEAFDMRRLVGIRYNAAIERGGWPCRALLLGGLLVENDFRELDGG